MVFQVMAANHPFMPLGCARHLSLGFKSRSDLNQSVVDLTEEFFLIVAAVSAEQAQLVFQPLSRFTSFPMKVLKHPTSRRC